MGDRNERGYTESVQWAMLVPLLMFVLLAAIQVGMLWHGRNTVRHAAAAAAEVESRHGVAAGTGQRSASQIARAGGIEDVTVTVSRSLHRVEVEVSGSVPVLVDLGMGRVVEQASAPVESTR